MNARLGRRPVCAASAALGVTVATAVVAIAAREPLSGSTAVNAASARPPVAALFVLLVGGGSLALAGVLAVLWPGRRRKGEDEPEPERAPWPIHWIWKLAALLVPLVLGVALVAAAALGVRATQSSARFTAGRPAGGTRALSASRSAASGFVVPAWLPWTALGIFLVALVGALVFLIARRRSPTGGDPSRLAATGEAVAAAMRALDGVTDPREAVIAAYAAMEQTLAAHGVARSATEAPREYLGRVLVAGNAAQPEARTLTALFEEARYSTHPIPEPIRERAWEALRSLRARLQTAQG
jgi:hypothetical protein